MKTYREPLLGALLIALLTSQAFAADDTAETIKQLQQRIEDLEQKVKTLEHNGQQKEEPEPAKPKDTPTITVGPEGFAMRSPDGDFALQFKGVLQVDSRTFFGNPDTTVNDGFYLRRARPILQGTIFRDFDFLFMPDFGGINPPQIYDAYINYRFAPWLQFQTGKFKTPIGLELLQPDPYTSFNERALPYNLMPIRDLGFELHGDLFGGALSYAGGLFNGVGDGRLSNNADFAGDKEFAGRIFLQPFKNRLDSPLKGFGFGIGGSYATMQATNVIGLPGTTGGTLPGYITEALEQFFAYNPTGGAVVVADGDHWRLSPQGYYYWGPFDILGEYDISDQKVLRTVAAPFTSARLHHTGWNVTAGWVLTGENVTYERAVIPKQSFNPREGHWGAWQVVARYSQLNLDPDTFPLFSDPQTSARSAAAWSAGLNWYLNRDVLVRLSFVHTKFDGGGGPGNSAPANTTQKDENAFMTRVQLAF